MNVGPQLPDLHAVERAVCDPTCAVIDEEDKGRGEYPKADETKQKADHGASLGWRIGLNTQGDIVQPAFR